MKTWNFIHEKLAASIPTILLYVLESTGSSPGRKGFKMAVAADGTIQGSIGGGIMEHKWVEKARDMLAKEEFLTQVIPQYHDKLQTKNRSGMICSGKQTLALIPLHKKEETSIEKICTSLREGAKQTIQLSNKGLELITSTDSPGFREDEHANWTYTETLGEKPLVHIIGAGHVGLALSELMVFLGFRVKIYDDRPTLNTLEENIFAEEKHIVEYAKIAEKLTSTPTDFIVILTFGYLSDKVVFEQLLQLDYYYLGMMGSDAKIQTLFEEMKAEGKSPLSKKHVFSPIGINILSKTPQEIAVSIAAEIIREKNRDLPSGRTSP